MVCVLEPTASVLAQNPKVYLFTGDARVSQRERLSRSMIPWQLQKRREERAAQRKVGAKRRGAKAPETLVRETTCIFRRPVNKITSHPGNVTKYRKDPKDLEKHRQRYALKRRQDLRIGGRGGSFLGSLDLTDPGKTVAVGMPEEADVQGAAKDLQGVTTPMAVQLSPSFYRQGVTAADIRRQTWKVKRARKRLAEALQADRLARQAENMWD
ncbi:methyl-CpG-binding domain protein 3-like 2B [Meriones unguiculatus]|uniref:methyl-CpG-binding domain protein 3-like 2B n=1 Tax=Meriones unguiculatus TaxID=10047 RepID=UPI00293E8876|nr:methyl-CpG-binding domain protein 3-like 2B [Meriones unguiculatus]